MAKTTKKKLARERKPFWHERLQCWYGWLYVSGKRKLVRLAKDEAEATQLWFKHRAEERKEAKPREARTVQGSIAAFIKWLKGQGKLSAGTVHWYSTHLVGSSKDVNGKPKENNSFGMFVGSRLKMSELKLEHIENWLSGHLAGATANGRNGAIRTVRRFVRWAMTRKLILDSPLVGLEVPQPESREVRISADDWKALLGAIPENDEFREFLKCLRATGMRPFELRIVEARHLQGNRLLYDVQESKGKKYRRSVPLNDAALAILKALAEKRPTGPLFRNARGRAWTKYAVVLRMNKYRKKAGLAEEITLYAIRHEFISAAIETGKIDPVTLAKIVGHRDLTMISKVYAHHDASGEHLQRAVRLAIGETAD